MLQIDNELQLQDLDERLERLWRFSAEKILAIEDTAGDRAGTPVFTVAGKYTAQGWTEWTQGFQWGSALLQFDATGDEQFLNIGRANTIRSMASHVTHSGVHDHGFNNVSTYGNLRRLMLESRIEFKQRELDIYELALKASGAVQAQRWSTTSDGEGYIYSFNGPHSLFCDTIRSLRSLAMAHHVGHVMMGENDQRISLLARLVEHARTTARYNVYYGSGRDRYDVRGRVAHESIFNCNDGRYRCPSTQQGYSPFTTWTRGLGWIMVGYAEELEFLDEVPDEELEPLGGRAAIEGMMLDAACAACDFYIQSTPTDGIPYWDTGAPGLVLMTGCLERPADPFNHLEPVDSSAAAIAAQGLLRLGRYLLTRGDTEQGHRYWQAGLTTASRLLDEPYLCTSDHHQGLLLHTVYHHPRGWDFIAEGQRVPNGESCQWGDYHLREVALYLQRISNNEPYYCFFGPISEG